ncbi:MAG TPA: hypothetical protein VNQ79_10535 [Blastocatellia bacterium]|nr:hypothetical protein [Blastocatellia bacterium]
MNNEHNPVCPTCKVKMKRHTPIAQPRKGSGRLTTTAAFSGILQEFHACPKCGTTVTQHDCVTK